MSQPRNRSAQRKYPAAYDPERFKCGDCGLGYDPDYPADRREHQRIHNIWKYGVRLPRLRSDSIVSSDQRTDFLLVTPNSSKVQKNRAARVALNAHSDTRFDFTSYDGGQHDDQMNTHAIIARRDGRGVGLVVLRRRDRMLRGTWRDRDAKRPPQLIIEPKGRWSVDFIWVRRDLRNHGLAARLLEICSVVTRTPASAFAWQGPLHPAAERLARRLSPNVIYSS